MTDAAAHDDARAEYLRALRDYTQLMRHRLANPLTSITAGIATLRELDTLDADARDALLTSMAEQAQELERVALYPIRSTEVERPLDPVAELGISGDELRRRARQQRKGMNEAQFRRINDQLLELADVRAQQLVDFVCECSDLMCAQSITLTSNEMEEIHEHPGRFAVAAGHEDGDVERILVEHDGWNTVEKIGEALKAAVEDAHERQESDGESWFATAPMDESRRPDDAPAANS